MNFAVRRHTLYPSSTVFVIIVSFEILSLYIYSNTLLVFFYLWGFHIEHFGDSALHDEEVRIVDVELYGSEEVTDSTVGGIATIDNILVLATYHYLKLPSKNDPVNTRRKAH